MPTMTRMHRHSSSSNGVEETRGRRRNNGGVAGDANKENFGVHFMSSPFGNSSLIALQDLSNVDGKSPQRRSFSEGSGPRQATPQLAALRCLPRLTNHAPTATAAATGGGTVALGLEDSQLSSSRMGDTTLDRMLDAIIESARKEVRCKHQTEATAATATATASASASATDCVEEWSESSVHEMEVRTPTHLKRQRVVRRKNQQKSNTTQNHKRSNGAHGVAGHVPGQKQLEQLGRQPASLEQIPSIKRCLSFSSSSSSASSDLEDEEHFAKRGSMASCASSASASVSASASATASTSTGEYHPRGSIDLSIAYDAQQQQLNVHVIRCRDLQRMHGTGSINAYVKVALATISHASSTAPNSSSSNNNNNNSSSRFQRTAVHRHSSRPYFDERFGYSVPQDAAMLSTLHLQLAVWHRDRHLKRSEFLGCLTFPLSALLELSHSATGSYKLHSQGCLHSCRNKLQQAAQSFNVTPTSNASRPHQEEEEQEEDQRKPATRSDKVRSGTVAVISNMSAMAAPLKPNTTTSSVLSDDVISISIDSMATVGKDDIQLHQSQQPMVLSKKALHQRDADENLFLRFLELDPPADGNANSTTATGNSNGTGTGTGTGTPGGGIGLSASNANANNANHLNGGNNTRRCSTLPQRQLAMGRTPFTMTKRLTRTEERGFGFSIVWTHPPRVEKVEGGLSADRCGILPGDYVIFVDKHNVVTMPEADVLNLIRSQGSSLTLEIFRRSGAGASMASMASNATITTVTVNNHQQQQQQLTPIHSLSQSQPQRQQMTQQICGLEEHTTPSIGQDRLVSQRTGGSTMSTRQQLLGNTMSRPATACSGTTSSIEAAKRRLHLPQVTFSKESIVPITDNRRRFLLQLISREQNFTAAIHFGVERFVQPLSDRKDLISPNDHRTLFQNIDELLRIAEDILEQLCNNEQEQEPHMNFASRVYLSKTTAICAAYKKYCNGIKRADCVLVNKSRQAGSEFIAFITEPAVPRKRPDLTMFIHRPLQHFREILKLMQLLASNCHVDTEEHKNFSTVINELQAAYREITVSSGLMEPLGEGRPLLTLQDLESRMVFTKCKPFTLAVQGRQWIFGGDLSRVEGRSIKPYWTLLFSDIIVFAKVSRDRVLFITEEPVPIANVVDSCFHMRKKTTEFRLTVDPNGRLAESPTGYCAPDLTRTPKRGARRKSLILRAPSLELKAVWQNLLQRQIFLVNAALGSTPLSSPLDSPDVLNTLVPLSDIGMTSASMGSMKLPSLDSFNLKQQKQQPRTASHGHGHAVEQIELLIDEKCRILNKTGTPKSSALHLANWMKGQLDKQQQQARLAAVARSTQETVSAEDEQLIFSDSDQDERITYWTRQQLEKRTKELNLAKENGALIAKPNFGGKRLSGVEELSMAAMSDIYSEAGAEVDVEVDVVPSQISQSHSTTSDSQITVRSSPIVLDKLAVCRHCHKNCQQQSAASGGRGSSGGAGGGATGSSPLLCTSLKVQHSQSSPNRCCKLNGAGVGGAGTEAATGSQTSMSSSTITGELSSKVVASSSRRETGDTESDVAQLITDELSLSQSEATDDSVGAMPNSSSSNSAIVAIVDPKLRVLDQQQPMANGHCSSVIISSSVPASPSVSGSPKVQPQPPPRRARVVAHLSQEPARPRANQQVKAIVTITETAKIMRSSEVRATIITNNNNITASGSASAGSVSGSPAKYATCHCRCAPEDFTQSQLEPDKMEHQTCKLLESPKQKATAVQRQEDDQLSLMLIGLAQFAPAAQLCGGQESKERKERKTSTPTIAVVPATPEAVLTKTSTNVWDNSSGIATETTTTTTATTSTTTTKQPRQAIIENIPEDSCDESPLEEEPPYRPMSNALRRFGTMSSLEKLPSDEVDDDLEQYTQNGLNDDADNDADNDDEDDDVDDVDEAVADKALAQNLDELAPCCSNSGGAVILTNGDVLASGAWTNRAGAFVSDKMSFFEESRAFIDKYLGRWNANEEQQQQQQQLLANQTASETDEQIDECTSGATSGEEVWGTPTSGGDNDDMQLINSENTHSSPTKSSTSLNDDDDTELMMDELLMAPPMTASTIRGLLPRRRLEPLFEEETESDEEKTQQDSDDIKKGEATTNGHYLEDSGGSSSDEAAPRATATATASALSVANRQHLVDREFPDLDSELDMDMDMDVEPPHISKERLQPNLSPRPLTTTTMLLPTTAIVAPPPVASSCEYLLEQRPSVRTAPSSITATTTTTTRMTPTTITTSTTTTTATTMKTTTTMSTTMPTLSSRSRTTTSRAPSSTTTTISSESGTISNVAKVIVKPPRFLPPPPPPRRLLLTQTNLSAAAVKTQPPQRKSGATADSGCSAAVGDVVSASPIIVTGSRTMPASTRTSAPLAGSAVPSAVPATAPPSLLPVPKRQSSTIIETSLLGAAVPAVSTTSSATVSRIAKPIRPISKQSSPAVAALALASATPPSPAPPPATVTAIEADAVAPRSLVTAPMPHVGCGLSPRLEMRLALNHDILGDEDLICYEPGPDLTTILGHDLSTFHRLTGRDLLSRSATNRVQPKEAVISYSQQRNSKMDTPTVNRRPRPAVSHVPVGQRSHSSSSHGSPHAGGSARAVVAQQRPPPSPNTWNSSVSVARAAGGSESVADSITNCSNNSGASKLGDLEILARREKIYCMSQSRSGYQARVTSEKFTTTTTTMIQTTTTTMATRRDCSSPMSRTTVTAAAAAAAASAVSLTRTTSITSMDAVATTATTTTTMTEACLETEAGKSNRLINFIKRRNSSNNLNYSDSTFANDSQQQQQQQQLQLHLLTPSSSQQLLRQSPSQAPDNAEMAPMSPRKDNDKPSLNRRLWKQITKRRRTNSVSQIVAG